MNSLSTISVGVADLDQVLELWCGAFGLELLERRDGDDARLARLWEMQPGDFRRQALVANPGETTSMLHFVEFDQPGPAVRDGSGPFDRCAKNLDVYLRDMPTRIADLRQAGYGFQREDYSEMTTDDGLQFREIHLKGHDAINIVLIEVVGIALPFTPQGFSGCGPVVTVVDDAPAERAFYREVLGLDMLIDNLLEGPMVEAAFGMPPGSAMDLSIWGEEERWLGRIQVVEYRGTEGKNLYPLAVPNACGVLQASFTTPSLNALTGRLDRAGISWREAGEQDTLAGRGNCIRLRSPAGFQLNIFETAW